jgi:hypothetical protein
MNASPAGWPNARVGEAPVTAFTSQVFVSYLDDLERRSSPSTVKNERAALRKLARYLQQTIHRPRARGIGQQ